MANGTEDLQMLRLIRAFQKLTDQDTRRTVVLYVEEQVEKQQTEVKGERDTTSSLGARSRTTLDL